MNYLADANVLSEITEPQPSLHVVRWLKENETRFVVDSIILGEIRLGIFRLSHGSKREVLQRRFDDFVQAILCLPWDREIALNWAELTVKLQRSGRSMPIADSMIAATALTHDLTIVSRNERDFQKAGLRVVNPFRD